MFKMKYTNNNNPITSITISSMRGDSQQLNETVIKTRSLNKIRTIGNMFEQVSGGVSCNHCGGFKTGF